MADDDTTPSSPTHADHRFGFQARFSSHDITHGDGGDDLINTPNIRKHLGFLSPNNFHVRNGRIHTKHADANDDDTNTVELVKQEISALRERVSSIDRANRTKTINRGPLRLDLDKTNDLQELNRTLIHIQAGLVAIEGERRHLINKTDKQQKENGALHNQLLKQQQEIRTCRNQVNDRKREATHLREMNQELSHKVIQLKMERTLFDATKEENEILRQKLCDSEQIKLTLDEQCQAMKCANDKAKAYLSSCIKGLGKLTTRKQECEQENEKLKGELIEKELVVGQLSREITSLTSAAKNGPQTQDEKRHMEDDLRQKDSEIMALREGLDAQMQELMTTSSELQRLQEECTLMHGLRTEVSALQDERNTLQETLHSKETTIAEISAQLLKLDLEREYAAQEQVHKHRSPLRALVSQRYPTRQSPKSQQSPSVFSPSHILRLGLSGDALAEVEACFGKESNRSPSLARVTP